MVSISPVSTVAGVVGSYAALTLQVGDRVNVVGTETAVSNVEKVLGNSLKRLNEPNLITIFIGIALGIVLGSDSYHVPGHSATG